MRGPKSSLRLRKTRCIIDLAVGMRSVGDVGELETSEVLSMGRECFGNSRSMD